MTSSNDIESGATTAKSDTAIANVNTKKTKSNCCTRNWKKIITVCCGIITFIILIVLCIIASYFYLFKPDLQALRFLAKVKQRNQCQINGYTSIQNDIFHECGIPQQNESFSNNADFPKMAHCPWSYFIGSNQGDKSKPFDWLDIQKFHIDVMDKRNANHTGFDIVRFAEEKYAFKKYLNHLFNNVIKHDKTIVHKIPTISKQDSITTQPIFYFPHSANVGNKELENIFQNVVKNENIDSFILKPNHLADSRHVYAFKCNGNDQSSKVIAEEQNKFIDAFNVIRKDEDRQQMMFAPTPGIIAEKLWPSFKDSKQKNEVIEIKVNTFFSRVRTAFVVRSSDRVVIYRNGDTINFNDKKSARGKVITNMIDKYWNEMVVIMENLGEILMFDELRFDWFIDMDRVALSEVTFGGRSGHLPFRDAQTNGEIYKLGYLLDICEIKQPLRLLQGIEPYRQLAKQPYTPYPRMDDLISS